MSTWSPSAWTQVLPPVSLTSADFRQKVEAMAGPRARASEMEHAIRHHINVHFAEDPVPVPPAQRAAGADPGRTRRELGPAGTCPSASLLEEIKPRRPNESPVTPA